MTADEVIETGIIFSNVLERIHSIGILHRDIKPSNVGYTKEGMLKLLDFGLVHMIYDSRRNREPQTAQISGPDPDQTVRLDPTGLPPTVSSEWIVGTPAYLSPEALKGQVPQIALDLWSTTVVLYEALAGCNPVAKDSLPETLNAVSDVDFPDIRALRADVPENLASFFRQALNKDVRKRPQNAVELRKRLEVAAARPS